MEQEELERTPRLNTNRNKREFRQKVFIFGGAFLSLAALLLAFLAIFVFRQNGKLIREDLGLVSESDQVANWLLVGSDTREGIEDSSLASGAYLNDGPDVLGRRADTLIIARIDSKYETIDLISIPRDLWVDIDGSPGRINSAYQVIDSQNSELENQQEGRRRLVRTIQTNLGIEINHYAEIDFVGFQKIIDSIGGVTIDFEKPAKDSKSGLDVPAGPQLLDGEMALAYARSRFYQEQQSDGSWVTDPTSDLGRTERQRKFIVEVAKKIVSDASSINLVQTDRQISVVADNLIFSNSVSYSAITNLAKTYQGSNAEGIRNHSLPVVSDRIGNASVLRLQPDQADSMLSVFRARAVLGGAKVDILNGSSIQGRANEVQNQLKDKGVLTGEIGNAESNPNTKIYFSSKYEKSAQELSSMFINRPEIVEDESTQQITLIIGADFVGLQN